jgi:hypothetical protein
VSAAACTVAATLKDELGALVFDASPRAQRLVAIDADPGVGDDRS